MKKVNSIVFCADNYKSEEEMLAAASSFAAKLWSMNQTTVARWDDRGVGTLIIEFESNDLELDFPKPHWLYDEEYMQISKFVYEVKFHDLWNEEEE